MSDSAGIVGVTEGKARTMATTPTKIIDKNGKSTTVHKGKGESASTAGSRASSVAPVAAAPSDKPISTTEIEAAIRALPDYSYDKNASEERNRIRTENQQTTRSLEKRWGAWLADEYASDVPAAAHAALYDMAWDEGHSNGYNSVEQYYATYAEFATKVAQAARVTERLAQSAADHYNS